MKKIKEGSRNHVIHYDSYGRHCSEPNCEVNQPIAKRIYDICGKTIYNGKIPLEDLLTT